MWPLHIRPPAGVRPSIIFFHFPPEIILAFAILTRVAVLGTVFTVLSTQTPTGFKCIHYYFFGKTHVGWESMDVASVMTGSELQWPVVWPQYIQVQMSIMRVWLWSCLSV